MSKLDKSVTVKLDATKVLDKAVQDMRAFQDGPQDEAIRKLERERMIIEETADMHWHGVFVALQESGHVPRSARYKDHSMQINRKDGTVTVAPRNEGCSANIFDFLSPELSEATKGFADKLQKLISEEHPGVDVSVEHVAPENIPEDVKTALRKAKGIDGGNIISAVKVGAAPPSDKDEEVPPDETKH